MATRCNVIVEDNSGYRIFMYRHNDGYPESVLPALAPILSALRNDKDFFNRSPFQSRLERIADVKKSAAYVAAKIEEIEPFEFTTDIHGDIEWLYTLNVDTTELHYEHLRTGLKQVR